MEQGFLQQLLSKNLTTLAAATIGLAATSFWKLELESYDSFKAVPSGCNHVALPLERRIWYFEFLQRLFVEMVQMARRPFSTVQVEVNPINVQEEDVATISVSDTLSRRKKVKLILIKFS